VTCDPVEDLHINTVEDTLARVHLSHILHVSVISKSDTLIQAIIQGFSTALSGTPLGMEVDVRKFPPRAWNVRFAMCDDSLLTHSHTAPLTTSLSTPLKNVTKKKKSRPRVDTPVAPSRHIPYWSDICECGSECGSECTCGVTSVGDDSNASENVSSVSHHAVPDDYSGGGGRVQWCSDTGDENNTCDSDRVSESSTCSDSSTPFLHHHMNLLDLSHYSHYARERSRKKARASFDMYLTEHHVPPDYGVAIEVGFCTSDDKESIKFKEFKKCKESRSRIQSKKQREYTSTCINNDVSERQGFTACTYSEAWQDDFSTDTEADMGKVYYTQGCGNEDDVDAESFRSVEDLEVILSNTFSLHH
jgi:hypothetical protein